MINGENGNDADSYIHLAAMITGSQILRFSNSLQSQISSGEGRGGIMLCVTVSYLIVHCLTSKITMGIKNSVGHESPLQLRAALVKALPIRKGDQTAKEEQQ